MQTVLVTGATSGIGRSLAEIYSQRGSRVLRLGRRKRQESSGRGDGAGAKDDLSVDLREPCAAERVRAFVEEQSPEGLDLLVHNAGVGSWGPVDEQTDESIRDLIEVNLAAPIRLTHGLLPHLARRRGKIVFISSVVSALACPAYAVYGGTKAALDGFARSLRVELAASGAGVGVQVIHPGATRTAMHKRAGMPVEVVDWTRFPPADEVAGRIARAIDGSRASVTIGLGNRVARGAGKWLAAPLDGMLRRRRKGGRT